MRCLCYPGQASKALYVVGHICSLSVIQNKVMRDQGFQVLQCLLHFKLLFITRCHLSARCNPNYIALSSLAQAFGLRNDVQHLVPGYLVQSQ